jgi:hypothetical protein
MRMRLRVQVDCQRVEGSQFSAVVFGGMFKGWMRGLLISAVDRPGENDVDEGKWSVDYELFERGWKEFHSLCLSLGWETF